MTKGISQSTLAENLGITFQQVQKYEKGTNRISASRLQDIARCLGSSVLYFFDDAPVEGSGSSNAMPEELEALTAFVSTAEGLELNLAFVRITDVLLRRSIVDLVIAAAR